MTTNTRLDEIKRRHLANRPSAERAPIPPMDALTWATTNATIVHPALGRIPFKPYPYQADFLRAGTEARRIVLKARQIGYSQVFALEALYTAIMQPESTILLVSRSQDLAANLLRYCYQSFNGLKDAPELVKQNEGELSLANGSRILSLPANRSTGRGFAATSIYLDEFAFAAYAGDIYQSVSPAASQGGTVAIGSSPNGTGNLFHGLYVNGANFWRQRVPWVECPLYYTPDEKERGVPAEQSAWYQRERPKYTEAQWASEFECSFEGSGNGLFRNIRRAATGTPLERGIASHEYVAGLDWGRTHDYTVLTVFDTTTQCEVFKDRFNQIGYNVQRDRIKAACQRFNVSAIIAETNSMGAPNVEQLERDGLPMIPFITTNASKAMVVDALALAFEQDTITILNDDAAITELEAFEQTRLPGGLMRYAAPEGFFDDCVISMALGWWATIAANEPAEQSTIYIYNDPVEISPF